MVSIWAPMGTHVVSLVWLHEGHTNERDAPQPICTWPMHDTHTHPRALKDRFFARGASAANVPFMLPPNALSGTHTMATLDPTEAAAATAAMRNTIAPPAIFFCFLFRTYL
jgi:hypothetical protein